MIGAGTDKNKELSSVENLSQSDWQYLKEHPEELSHIATALNQFDDSHRDQVMQMLNQKLAATTYEASKAVGNRSLLERLNDNGDNLTNRVDALAGMTEAERRMYQTNEGGFRDSINAKLKDDQEKFLAEHIAATTGEISPTYRVLMDGLKNAEPNQIFRDIEAAFKADPTLKDRINNPVTEEDKKLSQWFHSATHRAVDKAGLGDQYIGDGGTIPGEYETFENAIFNDGHLPLDRQLRLTDDKQVKIDLILQASDSDKTRLLEANPDAATKAFQDAVLGTEPHRREVLLYALQQRDANGDRGFLSAADQFRIYSLDGGNPDRLKEMLSGMTPEERQGLANEYFTKYHSLITADVIEKVPGDQQWRFRELLAPTDISVRQIALDAQMNNDAHVSSWDDFLTSTWDYTRVSADSSQDNLNRFIAAHAEELDRLTPDQRKQFDDAVANYMQAQRAYIDSKGEFASTFVDATITLAAIGGACFTGGTSLALLGAIGAGGAVYRTAMMASIQGSDFDSSAGNILRQSFEGGAAAMLGFLGPEQLGLTMSLRVGGQIAEKTALQLIEGSTKALFRDGAENILKTELANLTRQGAILGDKEIAAIAQRVAADGVDRNVVEQAIRRQLKTETLSGIKNVVLHEGESYVKNMVAAQIGTQGKELLATAVGFESPETLLDRMQGAAVSTVAGVTMFHGLFRIAASGQYVRVALGKDPAGNVVAGEGTVIRHADGTLEPVVGKDTLVKLKPGDTIYEKDALHDHPDGTRTLVVGERTVQYDASGKVTEVAVNNKERIEVDYVEDPVTHDSVLNKLTTLKPDGTIDTSRSFVLDNGVYYDVNANGTIAKPVGTNVEIAADGTITITGKGQNTEIGKGRFSNSKSTDTIDAITLRPDGTKFIHYADNASRTLDAKGRVTEEVSKDGIKATFEYSTEFRWNLEINRLEYAGKTYTRQNGKFVDADGKPFADDIVVDRFGSFEIVHPTDTLRTQAQPKDQIESIKVWHDGTPDYRYKKISEATTDRAEPPQAPTAEKVLEERIKSGDVTKQADGTYVHEDSASHSRTVYDANGEIVSVRNSAGQDINFSRNADGKITKIEYSRNGVVESTCALIRVQKPADMLIWRETDSVGNIKWLNEVRVEPDGSIVKLQNDIPQFAGVKERPDGMKIAINDVGRERVTENDLAYERQRVLEFTEKSMGGDAQRLARFEQWMQDFEANAAKRNPPLSQEEIANTYYQLDKLLSTDHAILSQSDRLKLAEQFIYKTANPHTIGQGQFNTCNVTAEIENRLIQTHPAEALAMVTDVATTGRFITQSGHIVDMTAMNNVMTPFRGVVENGFDPTNYSGRDYFDQLFQTTSVETYWQTQSNSSNNIKATSTVWELRAGETFRPGDLRYEFSNQVGKNGTGEVINDYSTNPPSRQLSLRWSTMVDPLTGKPNTVREYMPAESPNLTGPQMLDISRQITGVDSPPHMLTREGNLGATRVETVDELSQQLNDMKNNGGFPATVFVDSRDPIISGRAEDGGQGGAHVINVQNVFEKDGKLYVEFTNQWSSANDHMGDRAVPVEDLFDAMKYRPSEPAEIEADIDADINVQWYEKYKTSLTVGGVAVTGLAAYTIWNQTRDKRQTTNLLPSIFPWDIINQQNNPDAQRTNRYYPQYPEPSSNYNPRPNNYRGGGQPAGGQPVPGDGQ